LAGIRPGWLIQEVNRKPVRSSEQFEQAAKDTPAGGAILLLIKNGKHSRFLLLKLEK